MGGFLDNSTKLLYSYEAVADHWTKLAKMPFGTIAPASATVNGLLYCIGGSPHYGQPFYTGKVQINQP
jgi:N-acetylneuraminic acid mutarotase